MNVIWMSSAEDQLRPTLSAQIIALCKNPDSASRERAMHQLLLSYRSRIDEILSKTFSASDTECVVVIRLMRGFRRRADLFLLMVEVIGGSRRGRHVVKIGDSARLNDELQRWSTWRGAPLRHDVILLSLAEGAKWRHLRVPRVLIA